MIQVQDDNIQKLIEAEIGALTVQNLIKESTIARQQKEIVRLKEQLAALGVEQPQHNLGPGPGQVLQPVRKPDNNQGGL